MKKDHLRIITDPTKNTINNTKTKKLNFVMVPKQLITDTPNDSELGSIVRKMANE